MVFSSILYGYWLSEIVAVGVALWIVAIVLVLVWTSKKDAPALELPEPDPLVPAAADLSGQTFAGDDGLCFQTNPPHEDDHCLLEKSSAADQDPAGFASVVVPFDTSNNGIVYPAGDSVLACFQLLVALGFKPILICSYLAGTPGQRADACHQLLKQLEEADEPLALVATLNDLACCLAVSGQHAAATAVFARAYAQLEELGCPEVTCAQVALTSLYAFDRIGCHWAEADCAKLEKVLQRDVPPLLRISLPDMLRSNLSAARIRTCAQTGISYLAQAYQALGENQPAQAMTVLSLAIDELRKSLPVHMQWPIAAAYFDLGYLTLMTRGDEEQATECFNEAQCILAKSDDTPDWLPVFIERSLANLTPPAEEV